METKVSNFTTVKINFIEPTQGDRSVTAAGKQEQMQR